MSPLTEVERGGSAFGAMVRLLESAKLAVSDLDEGQPVFVAASEGGAPVAFAGVVGDGPDRLLRSVVVEPALRGAGIARPFMAAVEAFAAEGGAERLWLLTDSAPGFFKAVGYARRDRSDAPQVVRDTSQFRGLCPASAVLMCKTLL